MFSPHPATAGSGKSKSIDVIPGLIGNLQDPHVREDDRNVSNRNKLQLETFLSIISTVPAREKIVDLTIKGKTLSAKLKEIPLKDILEKLERETGIWFKSDESVFAEEVKNHKEQPSTGKLELFLLVLEKIISIFTQQPSYRNHSALSKC